MEPELRTVYSVKYVLTKGILEMQVKLPQGVNWENAKYVYTPGPYSMQVVLGRDAFFTRAEALAAAEEMRKKKILSLKKSIAKLEKLTF